MSLNPIPVTTDGSGPSGAIPVTISGLGDVPDISQLETSIDLLEQAVTTIQQEIVTMQGEIETLQQAILEG